MAEYIDKAALVEIFCAKAETGRASGYGACFDAAAKMVELLPAADVVPVRYGRWILEANKERTNYRWNVIAECSECCDEKEEIWAGFFHNVPDFLARDVALESAKSVKLRNYCPNCGAKMDGKDDAECRSK